MDVVVVGVAVTVDSIYGLGFLFGLCLGRRREERQRVRRLEVFVFGLDQKISGCVTPSPDSYLSPQRRTVFVNRPS